LPTVAAGRRGDRRGHLPARSSDHVCHS
jgi:hypothetical protein